MNKNDYGYRLENKGKWIEDFRSYRNVSLDQRKKLPSLKENMYPGLDVSPKYSKLLKQIEMGSGKERFYKKLETLEEKIINYYKRVEKIELGPNIEVLLKL